MKKLLIPIFFCCQMFMTLSAVYGDLRANPDFDAFYRHYVGKADRTTAKEPSGETGITKELPGFLKAVIGQKPIPLFDEIISVCNEKLFGEAVGYDSQMFFFHCGPDNPPARRLDSILDETEVYLCILSGGLEDLLGWLDNYPGNDWEERFGKSGFYDYLRQLQQKLIPLDCLWWQYRLLCDWHLGKDVRLGSFSDTNQLYQHLAKRLDELAGIINNSANSGNNIDELGLLQIRLLRAMVCHENSYQDRFTEQVVRFTDNNARGDTAFAGRFEVLAAASCGKDITFSDIDAATGYLAQLHQWVEQQHENIGDVDNKILNLAMFDSYLRQLRMTKTTASDGSGQRQYFSQRNFLMPLREAAQNRPRLRGVTSNLMAARLGSSLEVVTKSDTDPEIASLLKGWSDAELLGLADYYQQQQPTRYELIQQIYLAFLQERSAGNQYYCDGLYALGMCYYQQGKLYIAEGQEEKAIQKNITAIERWHQLTEINPHWSSVRNPGATAQEAITLAAATACELFAADNEKYNDPTGRVLSRLIGRVSEDNPVPMGPFAGTAAAMSYRYYYGLVLINQKRYGLAAVVFDAVPADDANKAMARYQSVYCRWSQNEGRSAGPDELRVICQPLVKQLDTLVADNVDKPVATRAMLLLIQICRDCGQIEMALPAAVRLSQSGIKDDSSMALVLELINDLKPLLLKLHAEDNSKPLADILSQSLPLARNVYQLLQDRPEDKNFLPAWQGYLEQMSIAVVNLDEPANVCDISDIDKLFDYGNKTPAMAKQLWFVRCRGLVEFYRGNYTESRQLWHRIRNSTAEVSSDEARYYWWESRYFSLRCLLAQGQSEEVAHVIDVLLNSGDSYNGPWLKRLGQLRQKAAQQEPATTPPVK